MAATQQAFHLLLQEIPEDAFAWPSDNAAWTIGEVLYHMSIAPRLLGTDARMITGQNRLARLVPIIMPRRLFNWLNKVLTRYGARKLSRAFLMAEYDRAHAAALVALAAVDDADFGKHVSYPDWDPLLSGDVTLERLFRYVKVHFDAHAGQIRAISNQPGPGDG